MSSPRILVIDDEPQIQKLLGITLEANNYIPLSATSGREGVQMARSHVPDLVLLDLGLPDIDGQVLLKELRVWYSRPIIILSVRNKEEDIVAALNLGANDYLIKPFRTGELIARVNRSLKPFTATSERRFKSGNVTIDFEKRQVFRDEELIKLTNIEYNLLTLLTNNEGKVLTHQHILREIWGPGQIEQTQYLRVYIAQLRKKIEIDPNRPSMLVTESGVGYRFVPVENQI